GNVLAYQKSEGLIHFPDGGRAAAGTEDAVIVIHGICVEVNIIDHLVLGGLSVHFEYDREILYAGTIAPGSASYGDAVIERGWIVNSQRALGEDELAGVPGKDCRSYGFKHEMDVAVGPAAPQ